jgi:hypothetical protein
MKTKIAKILTVLTASILSLSISAQVAAKGKEPASKKEPEAKKESTSKKGQSNPTEPKRIDLGSKLQNMHLHDGLNLVHSDDGVKLMAQARNNKVMGWSATDERGNKLPTKVQEQSTTAGGTVIITVTKNAKGSSKVQFHEFTISKQVDSASPR